MIASLVGFVTGLLSACGLGGGTLLVIYLTQIGGVEQRESQGINLLFYLSMAVFALPSHFKGGFLRKDMITPVLAGGILGAILGAIISSQVEGERLSTLFSWFLVFMGIFSFVQGEEKRGG